MPDPHDRWRPAPGDPSMLRIGDKERHAVAEVLREAAGEGRIDLDELEERLEATYAARTFADLVPITADLPTRIAPAASRGWTSCTPGRPRRRCWARSAPARSP